MEYQCADRGTRRCPCHLIAAGQCYTCTMTRTGRCNCEEEAGWQGVCPYTEYMQQDETAVWEKPEPVSEVEVLRKIHYGGGFFTVRLSVPAGIAEACLRPGAYLMAEAVGCRMPLSVLRAERHGRRGFVEIAVKATGPKTAALTGYSLRQDRKIKSGSEAAVCREPAQWHIAGPYFNGLLHGELLELAAGEGKAGDIPVICRGAAAVPFLAAQQFLKSSEIYFDDSALPEAFVCEYFSGIPFERVHLDREKDLRKMKKRLRDAADQKGRQNHLPLALLMVSPYYVQQLTEELSEIQKCRLVIPNAASLCCGMGFCGSCSHTDGQGRTVRLCKCSPVVVE